MSLFFCYASLNPAQKSFFRFNLVVSPKNPSSLLTHLLAHFALRKPPLVT